MRDVAELTARLAAPAIQACLTPKVCKSWFLGAPPLPDGVAWPEKDGKRLGFLACIDLAELAAAHPLPWLPASGSLSFFYDVANQPWGFDPRDRGSWSVIYQAESPQPQTEPFKSRNMAFREMRSLPSFERPETTQLALNEGESELHAKLCDDQYGDEPAHQIGGFPSPVQGDGMELEAQLVSNGIYMGNGKAAESPSARSLESGASSWKLLFQIDSDERLDFMWGDAGILYFWIREEDARTRQFDRAWVVLQCH